MIDDLISKTNIYISKQKSMTSLASVKEIARWVTRMIDMLGLDASTAGTDGGGKIGWSHSAPGQQSDRDGAEPSGANDEFHREVSKYRDGVRNVAMTAPTDVKKELLKLSDHLRDYAFANEGIGLDDRDAGQPALIKYIPKEELIAARQQKLAELALQESRKEAARRERERLEQEKLEQGRLSHLEMFRTDEFSAWNDDGIPTRDAQGEEITKSRSKKLRKDWDRQKQKHEAWLASAKSNAED